MEISVVGKEMLAFQEQLAKEYGYKPIEPNLFIGDVRQKYRDTLPNWCNVSGAEDVLYSVEGTKLANGYLRIVIGDYGAFVEISSEQIVKANLVVKPGQEFRLHTTGQFANIKYVWFVPTDNSDCKVYYQKNVVSYADYKPGMYYISPFECFPAY